MTTTSDRRSTRSRPRATPSSPTTERRSERRQQGVVDVERGVAGGAEEADPGRDVGLEVAARTGDVAARQQDVALPDAVRERLRADAAVARRRQVAERLAQ